MFLRRVSKKAAEVAGGRLLVFNSGHPYEKSLHPLATWLCGATNTRVHYAWRKLTAYCTTDEFIIRGDRFSVCLPWRRS